MKKATDRIRVVQGDITRMPVDAIVNAANSSLMGGGGVDGAIHRAGGPAILDECRKIVAKQGGCPTGEAVITTAGRMPSKKVIHTVGPVWRDGLHREDKLLASCYARSLQLALDHGCKTVAFPNISTGIYGFPKARAARIAVEAVTAFLNKHEEIQEVSLVCFDEENLQLVAEELKLQAQR